MDRNSRPNFAALSADEQRRRDNEEAGRHAAEDVGGMPERALTRFIFVGVILALIVILVWIAFAMRTT